MWILLSQSKYEAVTGHSRMHAVTHSPNQSPYADAVLIAYAEKSWRICITLVELQSAQNLNASAMRYPQSFQESHTFNLHGFCAGTAFVTRTQGTRFIEAVPISS